jgi:hypothetical protein
MSCYISSSINPLLWQQKLPDNGKTNERRPIVIVGERTAALAVRPCRHLLLSRLRAHIECPDKANAALH